jgi:hypothetical protein
MLKKTIVYILISCFVFSPAFAEVTYAVAPGSFAVKVEYLYSDGSRMIVSWNEGKEKHTLYPVTEGNNPINLVNYYKAGKLYSASITATQMRVNDDSGNKNLFSIDTNTAAGQAAPQSTPQSAPQSTPKNQPAYSEPQNDDVWSSVGIGLAIALVVIMLVGGLSSAGAK